MCFVLGGCGLEIHVIENRPTSIRYCYTSTIKKLKCGIFLSNIQQKFTGDTETLEIKRFNFSRLCHYTSK